MTSSQPVRFLLVGAGGYVANLAIFALLHAIDIPYLASAVISYFASNALMYLGNRYFTFRLGHVGVLGAYLRYLLVGGVVAGGNTLLLAGLVELAGLHPQLGLATALLLVTPLAFVLNKRWTFRVDQSESDTARAVPAARRSADLAIEGTGGGRSAEAATWKTDPAGGALHPPGLDDCLRLRG